MRLQPRRPPHGVHEAVRRADRPRHRPARPVRRVRRPLLRRTPDDLRPQRRLSLRAPAPVVAPAGTLLLDPLQPLVRIAPPPAAHFVRVRPELPGDRRVRHPPGRHQHDPRPLPQPHRRAPRPRPTLQNLPVPVRKLDPDRLPHGSSLSTPLDPARRETITLTTIVTRLYCGHYTSWLSRVLGILDLPQNRGWIEEPVILDERFGGPQASAGALLNTARGRSTDPSPRFSRMRTQSEGGRSASALRCKTPRDSAREPASDA